MGRLDGKVAIITGASRGIGAATARRFAAEGAAVVVNHHPEERMGQLARSLVRELTQAGCRALAVPADISEADQVDHLVDTTRTNFGDADVLVTNAATFRQGAWNDVSPDRWDQIFAVNVRGTYLCCKAVYPGMLRRGGGSIITVTSVTAHLGMTNMLDYVSTKGAIIAFTRSLAREVGPHRIRVNSVMPGAIRTEHEIEAESEEGEAEELEAWLSERQCLPQRGFADDLSGTFVHLASDDSAFVTGQVLAVDGGWVHR
jgi:3-oxoacyl-[acyl-carrier protein] reductase